MLGEWAGETSTSTKLLITRDDEHFFVQTGSGLKRLASVDNLVLKD